MSPPTLLIGFLLKILVLQNSINFLQFVTSLIPLNTERFQHPIHRESVISHFLKFLSITVCEHYYLSVLLYTPGVCDFTTENRYVVEQEDGSLFEKKILRSFLKGVDLALKEFLKRRRLASRKGTLLVDLLSFESRVNRHVRVCDPVCLVQ